MAAETKQDLDGWQEIADFLSQLLRRSVSVDAARRMADPGGLALPVVTLTPRRPQLNPDDARRWYETLPTRRIGPAPALAQQELFARRRSVGGLHYAPAASASSAPGASGASGAVCAAAATCAAAAK